MAAAVAAKQRARAGRVDAKRNVKQARLPVGTMVMLEDPLRSAKSEPRWVGPYRVVKVTKAGTYSLLDSTSALFGGNVPRQQLCFE